MKEKEIYSAISRAENYLYETSIWNKNRKTTITENKRICWTATLHYKSLKEKGLYKKVMWFVPMPQSLEEEEEIEKQMIEQNKDLEKDWKRVGFSCSPTWTDLDERDYQESKEEENENKKEN